MLRIHPASQAATRSRAMPLAPPTATRSGTRWARAQGRGASSSSTAIFRATPPTVASTPLPSPPRRAAHPPPQLPSGPKTKSHGRMIQHRANGPLRLRLRRLTLWLPPEAVISHQRVHQLFPLFLMVAPTVMLPPTPGVLLVFLITHLKNLCRYISISSSGDSLFCTFTHTSPNSVVWH